MDTQVFLPILLNQQQIACTLHRNQVDCHTSLGRHRSPYEMRLKMVIKECPSTCLKQCYIKLPITLPGFMGHTQRSGILIGSIPSGSLRHFEQSVLEHCTHDPSLFFSAWFECAIFLAFFSKDFSPSFRFGVTLNFGRPLGVLACADGGVDSSGTHCTVSSSSPPSTTDTTWLSPSLYSVNGPETVYEGLVKQRFRPFTPCYTVVETIFQLTHLRMDMTGGVRVSPRCLLLGAVELVSFRGTPFCLEKRFCSPQCIEPSYAPGCDIENATTGHYQ